MLRALVFVGLVFGAGAASLAQTPTHKTCAAILTAQFPALGGDDRSVVADVLQNDSASAVTTAGSPLAVLYGELAANGYMQAMKTDMPAPAVVFEWAKGGRVACADFKPESVVIAPVVWTGPQVILQTNMGDVTITLDREHAPKAAANFLRYAKSGYFNGAAIYRVVPNFVVQLGEYDAAGKYRPPKFPPIPLETATNHHERGAVAMAHADGDVNSAQVTFYFDLADNTALNAKPGAPPNTTGYAVFGHVTAGMDVVDKIGGVERAATGGPFPRAKPKEPIVVSKVVVKE